MNFINGKLPPFTGEEYEKVSRLSKKSRRSKLRRYRIEAMIKNLSKFYPFSIKEFGCLIERVKRGKIKGILLSKDDCEKHKIPREKAYIKFF